MREVLEFDDDDSDDGPDQVTINAFGHTFHNILSSLAEDLRTLEQEGVIYSRFADHDSQGQFLGTFTAYRIKLTPSELFEYVEANLAMQEFATAKERTGDFTAAVMAISSEKYRRRVVEYGEYGTRRDALGRIEDIRDCQASFLGDDLEALTCGLVRSRYEAVGAQSGESPPARQVQRSTINAALGAVSVAARRLSERAHARPSFVVENEYDVQDLAEVILRGVAVDVKREEWTPKRAGSAKRIDLVVPSAGAVVECKIVRSSNHAKSIADELRIDFECYHDYQPCKNLHVYIYDPNRYMTDPVQFCEDLNGTRKKRDHEFTVDITFGF